MDKLMNIGVRPTVGLQAPAAPIVYTHKVHIYTEQFGRRWVTTIHDLDPDLDLKRIARAMKRTFQVGVCVSIGDNDKEYIKLQGNQRDKIADWLVANEVMTEREAQERIVTHGVGG